MVYANALTLSAAVGILLLSPGNVSHALSPANFGSTPNAVNSPKYRHYPSFLSSSWRCTIARQSSRHPPPLWAVAENTIATDETCSEEANDNAETDIPISTGTPPRLTVVAGPGARITSVSRDVAVEQDFWESNNLEENDFVVDSSFPTPDGTKIGGVTTTTGREEKVLVDYDLFPDTIFHGEGIPTENDLIVTEIKNESENSIIEDTDSNLDDVDESAEDSSNEKEKPESDDESDDSVIRSTIAKSALLHRAGIAGTARKSSRSNGRSSQAKTKVNKSRRGAGRNQGVGSLGRVLGTVRTAAAAVAAERKKASEKSGEETKPGENTARGDNFLTTNDNPFSSNWKNAFQSTVADMLKNQDAVIQKQSLGSAPLTESTANSPPPGTTSMGLLGEVVEEKLPAIPPRPGTFLVRANEDTRTTTTTKNPQVSIRSSIPHSTDDTHIANLRLSVFSRFDQEQQRIFRSRSVEVLNVRRRRGSVVLVAEVPNEAGREHHRYPTEMQARIANGHAYGEMNGGPASIASPKSSSPSLTVTPVQGAKITFVSSGVTVDSPSLTVTPVRGAKVTSVSSGMVIDDRDHLNFATIGTNQSINNRGSSSIIGSVECSHQEFRGTMLGNSRPKGCSLMYVTEVAVRTDCRRCGAGAMLMKGVDEVATLRNVQSIYLHVDVANHAACAMYEKCGYHYVDKREPIYAQFTASLNLHDGAMHGRKHYLMCKNRTGKTAWLEEDDLFGETRKGAS